MFGKEARAEDPSAQFTKQIIETRVDAYLREKKKEEAREEAEEKTEDKRWELINAQRDFVIRICKKEQASEEELDAMIKLSNRLIDKFGYFF